MLLQLREHAGVLDGLFHEYATILSGCATRGYILPLSDLLRLLALLEMHLVKSTEVFEPASTVAHVSTAALAHIDAAESFARHIGDKAYLCEMLIHKALVQRALVTLEAAEATLQEAHGLAKSTGYAGLIASVERKQALIAKMYAKEDIPPFLDMPEEEKTRVIAQIIREKGGVDLDDPDDDIATVLRQGLKDRDPTRALKWCEHLELTPLSAGIPARMYGLPMAGTKILYCGKVEKHETGFDLDAAFELFRDGHCVGCPYRKPRPREWAWTERWQQQWKPSADMIRLIKAYRGA